MAARIDCSIQTSLSLLNLLKSKSTTHFWNRLKFRQDSFSLSKEARFSTCSTNNVKSSNDSDDPFVLTTPLYYVSAPSHMGSAYTTIAADAIARFQRLSGKTVVFITGTDEHGEKIAAAAAASGSSPSEHCDIISQADKTLWKDLDIAYYKFNQTTDPNHEEIVKEFYYRVR